MAELIFVVPHPHVAKALGGRVAGFDQQAWDEHRFDIIVAGDLAEFGEHAGRLDRRPCRAGSSRAVVSA